MTTVASPTRPRRRIRPRPAPVAIRPGEVDEAVSLVSSAFTMIAIVSLWFVLQVLVLSGFSQARDQHLLYGDFRQQLAAATAPTGPGAAPGAPVALITVPHLGLSQVVVEGTASGDLRAGPGHRRDTVLPGQRGISLVYGRASTYGAPFRHLSTLQHGDQIVVQGQQGRTVFAVDAVRRAGDPLPTPPTGDQARLTLVTAEGSGRLAGLRARDVVYVDATAANGQPAPARAPAAIPPSERAMSGDTAALPMLALSLGLLAALAAAITAARQRFATALVWAVASPVAIALSWFTTDVVVRLLPNLI
jgi:sortase A